ncbi:cupin domain-containing protein [Thalassotalea ponticola]|uniref:cupin domain-containing protein n=1 Tax=Thalassotalea ponticola TaxID=1523392 RepID=UPI0025B2FEB4|nr:cupin domain-containing protein [Thalassotalea ponticola]MDN3651762.1 cupin domain-containing protein [Thalassotalea ponticola]
MSLNLDRTQRLVINTEHMDWQHSPSPGVWRKKLEREEQESGLTTSIVRYDAHASFSQHHHPGGEEILVLDGVFEDEHGQYPAGSYFRNPPGTKHSPASQQGCQLFVKLNQFQSGDDIPVNINTRTQPWLPGRVPGLTVMLLHSFATEHTALVRWQPGTYFLEHVHPGGEEILVLDGVFEDEYGQYPKGTWIRSPHFSKHTPFSEQGCTLFVKTGYMR